MIASVNNYVSSLQKRKEIIIDIDATKILPMDISSCNYLIVIMGNLCIMNYFFIMDKPD